MKKLTLLALCASVAALCQNPPVNLPPQFNISSGAPAGTFAIDANGNATFNVSTAAGSGVTITNPSGTMALETNTGNASSFAPALIANAKGTGQPGLFMQANIANGFDSGTNPLFFLKATYNLGAVVTRPLLTLYNNSTAEMTVNADGSTVIPQLKSATGTRYVCVDTTGKLISSGSPCSGT